MLYEVEGIIVRTMNYGEAGKILVVFSKQQGKISLMARGAKKLKSRHASVSQLFTHGDFTYYKGGSSQMGTLNQGDILHAHRSLHEDLHKAAYAAYLVELVDRLFADQEGSSHVFNQLSAGLTALEEDKDPPIVIHIFELLMLHVSGYAPVLDHCSVCGKEVNITDKVALSIASGGYLCGTCMHAAQEVQFVDAKTFKLMRLMQHVDLRKLGSISVSVPTKQQLGKWLGAYIDYHTNVFWKSRHFIDQMKKFELS